MQRVHVAVISLVSGLASGFALKSWHANNDHRRFMSEDYRMHFWNDESSNMNDERTIQFDTENAMKKYATYPDVDVVWIKVKRPGTHITRYIEKEKDVREYLNEGFY